MGAVKEIKELIKGEFQLDVFRNGERIGGSDWGSNLITLVGFNKIFSGTSQFDITAVLGTGTGTVSESDTTLFSYKGKSTSDNGGSAIVEINTTPDVDGYMTIITTGTHTFATGSLGSGPVNLTEAGIAIGGRSSVTGSTNIMSHSLLKDSGGTPITVSIDASVDYVELKWKVTRYIKAEVTGSKSIDILGTPTSHDYVIRPVFLTNSSYRVVWWNNLPFAAASTFYGFLPTNDRSGSGAYYGAQLFDGSLSGNQNDPPSGTGENYSSITLDAYVSNSKEQTFSVNVSPADGNLANDIRSLTLRCTNSGYQVQFDPKIVKKGTPSRSLRLDFKYSMANK